MWCTRHCGKCFLCQKWVDVEGCYIGCSGKLLHVRRWPDSKTKSLHWLMVLAEDSRWNVMFRKCSTTTCMFRAKHELFLNLLGCRAKVSRRGGLSAWTRSRSRNFPSRISMSIAQPGSCEPTRWAQPFSTRVLNMTGGGPKNGQEPSIKARTLPSSLVIQRKPIKAIF